MAYKYNFATGKLDFYLPTDLPIVPDVQVFFSTTLPTDAGVIFTPNTPSLENVLYISEISGQVYIYNGTNYVSYTSVTPNNTAWYLAGTTIDAGGSKSASISRNNAIYTIGYDSFFNSVRVGRGNNNIATNTVVGSGAGNTISTGDNNTFNGSQSGRFNSIGKNNSFYGVNSGFYNSGGSDNINIGNSSGMHIANGTTSLTTADKSVFLGADTKALANNQTNQIVIGYNAIGKGSNTVNIGDSFITNTYLQGITSSNSFISVNDSYFNGVKIGKGTNNIATNTVVGAGSGDTISTGSGNSFFGANSGRVNSIGNFNSFFGTYAGYSNTFADSNTFIGNSAGYNFTTGGGNVSVGYLAGKFYGNLNLPLTTGSNSVYIGNQATALVNGSSNEIVIGSQAMGKGANTVNIGNTSITNTYLNGAVTVNNAYTLPTADGLATQALTTNGSGTVSWADVSTLIPQADTIYIDSVSGVNAATGRGDINKPYLTVEYVLSNITNTGTVTGNTATSTTISGISDINNASLKIGQNIGGTGIPFNTIIIAKGNQGGNANTITISKPATATATGVTITWISPYTLVLNGTFIATSNWFKQGMFINAQQSNISWSGFTLFNNTTLQIMSYALFGNGNYYGASAANTKFFNYQVAQTSEFICNINYDNINTNDTGAIFNGNIDQGQLIIKGNLARANFGSVSSIGNTVTTFYSSTYGLTYGHSIQNFGSLNLIGGKHETPASVTVMGGTISYFNSECTLYGSVNAGATWTHVGPIGGTSFTIQAGSINAIGGGTIYASGGSISASHGNIGNIDLVVTGNVECHGNIRGVTITSGKLINNAHIATGLTVTAGTLINNGFIETVVGQYTTLAANATIINFGYINLGLWGITGGTLENRGNIDLTYYGQATGISSGTLKNYGVIKNVSKDTDMFQLSGTGVIENYGTFQNTNVNTTSAIIKKTGGTVKLYPGSILKVANGLSPIWCVNNDAASKDIYLFNCITNCNGTSYGLGYAFPTGFVPNDLVGGVKYENVNY